MLFKAPKQRYRMECNSLMSRIAGTFTFSLVGLFASTSRVSEAYTYIVGRKNVTDNRFDAILYSQRRFVGFAELIRVANEYKKLIMRWDSERELSLRRHCTRTKKYNRLLHKFRHDRFLQRGYVMERMFTKFSEITWCNGHYVVQGHSRSPILVPIESPYTTFY